MADYQFADAHCHLDSCAGALLPHALYITCGTSHETNLKNLRIVQQNENAYLCAGISPQEAMKHPDIQIVLQAWEEAITTSIADSGKLVAIGEIGLDYHWAKTEEEKHLQQECFVSMLQLAEKLSLPVVIHSRDAEEQVLDIVKNFNLEYMMHCFSGKAETAAAAVAHKGIISIPPIMNSERKKFTAITPLEKLVAESDAPGIGKAPEAALESIKMIAEIRQLDVAAVQKATLLNTVSFFKIK